MAMRQEIRIFFPINRTRFFVYVRYAELTLLLVGDLYQTRDRGSKRTRMERRMPSLSQLLDGKKQAASGSTVDLNNLREATKKFQLGDSMHGLRTPRHGSQDSLNSPARDFLGTLLGSLSNMAFPPGAAFPPHMAGAPANTQPPPMMIGVGVRSGPIPEDIFHGESTIATFQAGQPAPYTQQAFPGQQPYPGWTIAASGGIPPQPGTTFPNGGAPQQGAYGDPGAPQWQQPGGPPASFEVASGVPPQAVQQQGFPAAELSLPDGGVPPKAPEGPPAVAGIPGPVSPRVATDLSALAEPGIPAQPPSPKGPPKLRQVPRGAPASKCFKVGLAHVEQNQLTDAMSCFNEAFLALGKDQSLGFDVNLKLEYVHNIKLQYFFRYSPKVGRGHRASSSPFS